MSIHDAEHVVDRELSKARFVLMATYGVNGFVLSTWFSRLPSMADRVGVGSAQLGIVLFALTFASLLAIPVGARNLLRWRATRIIRITGPLTAVALFLAALSTQIWQLALALVFFGVVNGTQGIGLNAHATTLCRLAGRHWMPAMFGCASAAGVIGAALGTVATTFDVPVVVHVVLVSLVCLSLTLALGHQLPVGGGTPSRHIIRAGMYPRRPVLRLAANHRSDRVLPRQRNGPDAVIVLLIGAALGATIAEGALANFSIVIFRDVLGIGLAEATLAFTIFSVVMAGMRLSGGWAAARLGPTRVLVIGGVTALLGGLVLAGGPGLLLGFVALAVVAVGIACAVPITMQLATAHAHDRAAATADGGQRAASAALAGVSLAASGGYLSGGPILGLIATLIGLPGAVLLVPTGALGLLSCSALLSRRQRPRPVQVPLDEILVTR